MIRKLLAATALALVSAAPVSAATFVISGTSSAIPEVGAQSNSFASELGSLLGVGIPPVGTTGISFLSTGASLTVADLAGPVRLDFYYLGSESDYRNRFGIVGGTDSSPVEDVVGLDAFNPVGQYLFSQNYGNVGDTSVTIDNLRFFSETTGFETNIGETDFAIFVPTALGGLLSNVTLGVGDELYFGFDDNDTVDDNHDDMIIRARLVAVPEASTWAMLIAGFITVGAALRRRNTGRKLIQAV